MSFLNCFPITQILNARCGELGKLTVDGTPPNNYFSDILLTFGPAPKTRARSENGLWLRGGVLRCNWRRSQFIISLLLLYHVYNTLIYIYIYIYTATILLILDSFHWYALSLFVFSRVNNNLRGRGKDSWWIRSLDFPLF